MNPAANGERQPRTAIASVEPERVNVRGFDLCRDLIGQITFTEQLVLLVTGVLPSAAQRAVTDAALVAIAEHGLVPSVVAARMTLAAGPEAWQGAVAAGILGCGSVVLGSAEQAGRTIVEALAQRDARACSIDEIAGSIVAEHRAERRALPGFGFPAPHDPRAERLFDVAARYGLAGDHVAMIRSIAAAIPAVYGRALPINVSGALAAVLLDAGFPVDALKGVPILARTAGLIGHLMEESQRSIGLALGTAARDAAHYDGPDTTERTGSPS
jgi:citrate synthase